MGHLEIDYALPVALLVGSLVGALVHRFIAARGLAAARRRTARLLAEHTSGSDEPPHAGG